MWISFSICIKYYLISEFYEILLILIFSVWFWLFRINFLLILALLLVFDTPSLISLFTPFIISPKAIVLLSLGLLVNYTWFWLPSIIVTWKNKIIKFYSRSFGFLLLSSWKEGETSLYLSIPHLFFPKSFLLSSFLSIDVASTRAEADVRIFITSIKGIRMRSFTVRPRSI